MATVTGMTYEQARSKQDALKAQGKTASTSKEYGKLEDYIKTLKPQNYGTEAVNAAQAKLAPSTQQPVSGGFPSVGMPAVTPQGSNALNLDSIYNEYFNTPDIQAKKKEASEKELARDEAIGSIQNNPWYSQATRGGKIASVKSDAERNLERINSELGRMQSDAQIQYNIKLQQYDINRQAHQDALTLFNGLVSSGALQNASGSDIAKLSIQTGIPTSMIGGIIQSSKEKNLSLQSIDDGTGQYIIAVDPQGNVTNKTYLGPSKSAGGFDTGSFLDNIQLEVERVLGAKTDGSFVPSASVLTPPPMSGKPGAVIEYPKGSGINWTAGSDGMYR